MQHRCMRPFGSRPFGRKSWKAPTAAQTAVTLAAAAVALPGFFAARPALAQQAAPAPAAAPAEPIVSLDLRDARLEQAIAMLAQKSGFNIVTEPANPARPYGLVNIKLDDKPVGVVLRAIAASAGATISDEDGIYHLRPRTEADTNPKPVAVVAPQVAPAVTAAPAPVEAPRRRQTQLTKIKLNYVTPSDFVKNLDDPTYLGFVQASVPVTIDTTPKDPYAKASGVNFYPNSVPGAPASQQAPASTPPSGGAAGTSAGRDGDSYASAGQRGLGGRGGGGQGGFGQGGLGGGQGGGLPGAPGGAGGQNGQASLRPPGIQNIIASDADNALIVDYDDVEDLNRLREIVKLLDVAPRQVIIKAEFVAVNIADADSFGIDWNITPANNLNAVIPPLSATAPTITLAYSSGNAVANLRAALTRSTSNVLQAPIIGTTNNRPASINVSQELTIFQTQTIVTGAGTAVSGNIPIQVPASNQLIVTPHINGDNSISMFLQPQLQTVSFQANGGITRNTQNLTTTRRVQNGETMVLGGFITKNETITLQKVPLLSDLPIIGNLFTQRDRTVTGSEILVFITPTIIEDRAQGTVGTGGNGSPAPTP